MSSKKTKILKDFLVVIISIIFAVFLVKSGLLDSFFGRIQDYKILSSFLAGIFFVSFFTVAPASVVLAELAQNNSILLVSFFAGLGALIGDFIIFKFIRDTFSKDLLNKRGKVVKYLKNPLFAWLAPIVGAIIIASPFPDELGLALMGLSKTNNRVFIVLSFTLNFIGIFLTGLILRRII